MESLVDGSAAVVDGDLAGQSKSVQELWGHTSKLTERFLSQQSITERAMRFPVDKREPYVTRGLGLS